MLYAYKQSNLLSSKINCNHKLSNISQHFITAFYRWPLCLSETFKTSSIWNKIKGHLTLLPHFWGLITDAFSLYKASALQKNACLNACSLLSLCKSSSRSGANVVYFLIYEVGYLRVCLNSLLGNCWNWDRFSGIFLKINFDNHLFCVKLPHNSSNSCFLTSYDFMKFAEWST